MAETEEIVNRLDLIIGLLSKLVFEPGEIELVVTQGKRNPHLYKKAYNAMDGQKSVTNLAKIAKVTKSAMSQVISTWEKAGIVTNVGSQSNPKYRKLTNV
jgi:DNA-binding MarR family transcriptional regulator